MTYSRGATTQTETEADWFGDDGENDCPTCGGSGTLLDCCDDICQGQGFCMHGDGERMCPTCKGEGI